MKKRMKEIVKKHLMTLGVVVGVCGALMIIIPTCGGEEKAAEQTGYSEEYLDAYSLHLYAYADTGIEKRPQRNGRKRLVICSLENKTEITEKVKEALQKCGASFFNHLRMYKEYNRPFLK